MVNNILLLKPLKADSSVYKSNTTTPFNALHSHWTVSNFIVDIFSKAFLSLFADFYSPLKHPYIR